VEFQLYQTLSKVHNLRCVDYLLTLMLQRHHTVQRWQGNSHPVFIWGGATWRPAQILEAVVPMLPVETPTAYIDSYVEQNLVVIIAGVYAC